tara:strand:+ start:159 stop:698 length:540 start_codon:yes stop_codon:yes gene_type:complete
MHKFNLKKYYFISDYNINLISNIDKFTNIIYRNYDEKINIEKILILRNFCQKRGNRIFLANDVKLAIKLGFNGVYLPSFNKSYKHLSFNYKKKFLIIGSAHSQKEIKIKKKQCAQIIFLSSLFKNNKNYLGLNKFKLITNINNLKFVALGGLNKQNLKKLQLINVIGYAGISIFKKKGP